MPACRRPVCFTDDEERSDGEGDGGQEAVGNLDEHAEVGAEPDEGERALENQREPRADARDGAGQGTHRTVDVEVGAAGLGHPGGRWGDTPKVGRSRFRPVGVT
jgi:hypothetical protein